MWVVGGEGVANPAEKRAGAGLWEMAGTGSVAALVGMEAGVMLRVSRCLAFLGRANSLPEHLPRFPFPPAVPESSAWSPFLPTLGY